MFSFHKYSRVRVLSLEFFDQLNVQIYSCFANMGVKLKPKSKTEGVNCIGIYEVHIVYQDLLLQRS